MLITEEQVKVIAAQARLTLDTEEIVSLVRKLQELRDHVADYPHRMPIPEGGPEGLASMPAPCRGLSQAEVVALAPDGERGFIRVPRVMGDD